MQLLTRRKRLIVLDEPFPDSKISHVFFVIALQKKATGISKTLGSRSRTPGSGVWMASIRASRPNLVMSCQFAPLSPSEHTLYQHLQQIRTMAIVLHGRCRRIKLLDANASRMVLTISSG